MVDFSLAGLESQSTGRQASHFSFASVDGAGSGDGPGGAAGGGGVSMGGGARPGSATGGFAAGGTGADSRSLTGEKPRDRGLRDEVRDLRSASIESGFESESLALDELSPASLWLADNFRDNSPRAAPDRGA